MLENFVFVATLALYIEFPAIQDLIYTKTCLQLLSQRSEFDKSPFLDGLTDSKTIAPETLELITLPSNGRIQELSVSVNNATSILSIAQPPQANKDDTGDIRSLCSRMNKSAVPKEVKQDILDLDSMFWLKYQLIISLLSVFASPYWGGVSDKIGRLIPLNVPITASIVCNLISLMFGALISLNVYANININWLYCGAVIVGISGGQPVLISNSFSFLSDNTSSDDRTKRVTILETTIFLAHSLGFFLSKLMMSLGLEGQLWENRHFVAFGSCVVLNSYCLIYSFCNLRHRKFHKFLNNFEREQREITVMGIENQGANTSPKSRHTNISNEIAMTSGERLRELTVSTPDDLDGPIVRANTSDWTVWNTMITFRHFKETYSSAMKPRESRTIILLLLLCGFTSALSLATLMSLFYVYVKMDPFNWTTSQYSVWNSISAIARGIALFGLTLGMKSYSGWNVPDPLVAIVGFLSKASGLLLIGLAQNSPLLYWSLACFTLSEYAMPPIRSLLSKLVAKEELCKIYSCLGSLQSLCFILGNIAFYVAFNYTTRKDYFRLSFIFAAAFEFGAASIMLIIYFSLRRRILVT